MTTILNAESKLTDRYQTTVPEPVRRALQIGKGDRIHYAIRENGEVVLTRVENEEEDPVLSRFLEFLASDMAAHPDRLEAVGNELALRIEALVGDIPVDLDAPLNDDDE